MSEKARLRQEIACLREALEDVLVILGNPATYHEDDRTEVTHAVGRVKRALGLAPKREQMPVQVPRRQAQGAAT